MALKGVFLLFITTSLILSSAGEQLQGKMETEDGSECVWFELRKSGKGSVFVTACHCRDGGGKRQSYSCEYEGPMEDCEQLLNITKKEFYDRVANSLQKSHANPCTPSSISIEECPDVVLQKYKGSDLQSPCVPEPKDEL